MLTPLGDKGTPFVAVVEQLKQWSFVWMKNVDWKKRRKLHWKNILCTFHRNLLKKDTDWSFHSTLLWHLNKSEVQKKRERTRRATLCPMPNPLWLSQNNRGLPQFTESETPHQHIRTHTMKEFGYKKQTCITGMSSHTRTHSIRHTQTQTSMVQKYKSHVLIHRCFTLCGFFSVCVILILQKSHSRAPTTCPPLHAT